MLRETVDDWMPDAMSELRAESRADVRDMACYCPGRTLKNSALQVDDDVEQISAGLERLRVRGEAALRLDHRGQFVREIDVGVFQRTRLDGPESALAGQADLHVSGVQVRRIDVADLGRQMVRARYGGERDLEARQFGAVLEHRGDHALAVDIDLLHGGRRVAVNGRLEVEARCDLGHGRHVDLESARAAWNCDRER